MSKSNGFVDSNHDELSKLIAMASHAVVMAPVTVPKKKKKKGERAKVQ